MHHGIYFCRLTLLKRPSNKYTTLSPAWVPPRCSHPVISWNGRGGKILVRIMLCQM
jgi:hypothetical protein